MTQRQPSRAGNSLLDGALYVSTLSGAPFLAGSAAIYRVVPGAAPQVYAGGFKTITDFDWGRTAAFTWCSLRRHPCSSASPAC